MSDQSLTSGSPAAAYPGLTVALSVECPAWAAAGLGDIERLAQETFAAAAARLGLPETLTSEIALTLADDETVRGVNAEWRDKDRPTNILSFPMADLGPGEPPGPLMGDLILAHETVAREAREEDKAFADHFRHLLVHGFLHLMGFDHAEDAEADVMEAHEVAILQGFGIADPYLEHSGA
ncbi:rRNA maturation RNase YbeY [Aurantimonas sp. VKM B-3413]|uniref:rRNA maturation RNase YbeY n=1 Tax=Aurantimonas sp. VKM B-3413 TaxID=2779401 RepID=UPI001E2CE76A|nr:rRNA maturation RNase YbeY [Aurantimonas sp. VKM B-3413]MCB8840817.1 rRNA maturation RNase YbeY [Aurantimonas sp. VKM B-3413]